MKTTFLEQPIPSAPPALRAAPIALALATERDRETIYRLRHDIYAGELGQHHANATHSLRDGLDGTNIYIVARIAGDLAGFVSVTPPEPAGYSVDKYIARAALPFAFD